MFVTGRIGLEENVDLFRRNGFEIVETFSQWFNFAGFLCVKKPTGSSLMRGSEGSPLSCTKSMA